MKRNKISLKRLVQFFYVVAVLLIAGFLSSCTKMRDNYAPFIKDGEQIYTGKVDSIVVSPGKNRLKLTWLLVSDPKITHCRVYWNDGLDSLNVPVHKTENTDTINVMIDHLAEGLYSFYIYTYDDNGHSSVRAEVTGTVYGDNFAGSIFNRSIDSAEYHALTKDVHIKWFGVAAQAASLDVIYTDTLGIQRSKYITKVIYDSARPAAFLDQDILDGYKEGTSFRYRTGYLPTDNAMDTFFIDYKEVTPTLYVPPPPPTGISNFALNGKVTASSSGNQNVTDGDRSGTLKWQPASADRVDLNVWIYVDLGDVHDINTTQVYFTKDPGKITYYEVQYTADVVVTSDTKWKRAFFKEGPPDEEDIVHFSKVSAKFVKVNIGLRDDASNINLSEIEVYNYE